MDIIAKDLHLNTKRFSDIHNLTPKVDSIVKKPGSAMDFATFMGPEITVPIRDGQCILGTWL